MTRRRTHEEFVRKVREKYGDEYEILGEYKNGKTKILVKHNCKKCNYYEWNITPENLLQGRNCPKCGREKSNKKRTKTHEEFVQEVRDKYGDEYKVLGSYINSSTKILVRHKCGYEWGIRPDSLLRSHGCPKCKREESNQKRTRTHEDFIKAVKENFNDEFEILGTYINAKTKIKVKHNCKECNFHEWEIIPNNLLRRGGCPICSSRTVKLGVNTIWDTDRWMVNLGISEEDAKKYSRCSNKKITVTCPDCGREKKMVIASIYKNKSIFCSCGDGKSYPEKFVFNLLEQLDLEFEIEYKPKWIEDKRYDFHLKDNDCIIESHGEQHYIRKFNISKARTLKEEQGNDKFKREIALKNGIKHYIELDCRESNLEYIKNSILNSELNDLFDLNNINWQQCAEFANSNRVKEVCDYWKNRKENETTTDLGKIFKLDRHTIRRYLKKGTKLGWCKYNPKEESLKTHSLNGKSKGRKLEIFKNNKSLGIFESCVELERKVKSYLALNY